jgi:hypothetical protein
LSAENASLLHQARGLTVPNLQMLFLQNRVLYERLAKMVYPSLTLGSHQPVEASFRGNGGFAFSRAAVFAANQPNHRHAQASVTGTRARRPMIPTNPPPDAFPFGASAEPHVSTFQSIVASLESEVFRSRILALCNFPGFVAAFRECLEECEGQTSRDETSP